MRRGDLVSVALSGDFGKPRPALVVQSDQFSESETIVVLLVSSDLIDAPLLRLDILPDETNQLRKASQIMVDKVMTVRRDKVGSVFGHVGDQVMVEVTRAMALFFGFT
jgi:mRNA interferase MazF